MRVDAPGCVEGEAQAQRGVSALEPAVGEANANANNGAAAPAAAAVDHGCGHGFSRVHAGGQAEDLTS